MLKFKTIIVTVLFVFSMNSVTHAAEIFPVATNDFASNVSFDYYDAKYDLDSSEGFSRSWDDVFDLSVALEQKPEPEIYTVVEGDNLYRIALEHDIPLDSLMSWNDLTGDLIHPGDELVLFSEGEGEDSTVSDKVVAVSSPVVTSPPKEESREITTPRVEDSNVAVAEPPSEDVSKEMVVTATAYTAYCKGCSGTTAYGIDLRANPSQKVIAVDPRIIPLGTKVWVEGYGEAIAGDTGGAIKGNKIDVFIPSHDNAMEWGVKKVKIKVLN